MLLFANKYKHFMKKKTVKSPEICHLYGFRYEKFQK